MKKIVIIGGGVSGLSSGIYALLNGFDATIIESHNILGGNLTGWNRKGYHIDNCIHWLTGTNKDSNFYKIWETLGVLDDTPIYTHEALFKVDYEGDELGLYSDFARFESELYRISKEDSKEIKKFIKAIKAAITLQGTDGGDKTSLIHLLPYFFDSIEDTSLRFKHPLIRKFITALMPKESSVLSLIYVYASFVSGNASLPKGGSLEALDRMVSKFISLGGTQYTRSKAVSIVKEKRVVKGVVLNDGRIIDCDYVILACDPIPAISNIFDIDIPKVFLDYVTKKEYTVFSGVQCAISAPANLPFKGTIIDHVTEEMEEVMGVSDIEISEFSHEESYAPEGRNIIQTLSFCKGDISKMFINLRENNIEEYRARKKKIGELIIEYVENRYPELKGQLEVLDVWTPATYKRYTGSATGSYMSPMFPKGYMPRFINNKIYGFKNAYMASQWLFLPGGLPPAAQSGKKAIESISRKERRYLRRQTALELE